MNEKQLQSTINKELTQARKKIPYSSHNFLTPEFLDIISENFAHLTKRIEHLETLSKVNLEIVGKITEKIK